MQTYNNFNELVEQGQVQTDISVFNKYPAHVSQAILDINQEMGKAETEQYNAIKAAKEFQQKWNEFMNFYRDTVNDPKSSQRLIQQFDDAVDFRRERADKILRQIQTR